MSYLKTINIQHLTSGTNNIVLDANGNMTCAGTISAATPTGGMRNKIINGDMRIDQRNAGAAVTVGAVGGTYYLDRWTGYTSQASKLSIQQNAGSVTPPVGFTHYMGFTSLSTYAVSSSDYFFFRQVIEGLNASDLAWGTSNAKTITLSFWARSSLTGTFGGAVYNATSPGTTYYLFPYTINTSNTWEYKTITIPGPTTGTWPTDNSGSIVVAFSLGAGSSRLGTANTWTNPGGYDGPTGSVSVVGTNGATLYLTGVQFEVGSIATPFERRLYSTELALCQRYCLVKSSAGDYVGAGIWYTSSSLVAGTAFPTTMRSTPTLSGTCSLTAYASGSSYFTAQPTLNTSGPSGYEIYTTALSGAISTGGHATSVRVNTGSLIFTSEL